MGSLKHSGLAAGQFALAAAWLFVTAISIWGATPLGTAFTYQGQLKQNGSGVSDTCDFAFSLWDDAGTGNPPVGGSQIGSTLTFDGQGANPPPISVSNGLFSVELDFGAGAFTGEARWLEIVVRSPHDPTDTEPFTTLVPRQPLTAAPYALYALGGPGSGATPWGQSGSNIFYSAGNVGIGTTNPVTSLDVRLAASGNAAQFENALATNVFATLVSRHLGSGAAVLATNQGTGRAGDFRVSGSGNSSPALRGLNQASGSAGLFEITSPSNTAPALHAQTNASDGYAGYFVGGRNYFEGNVGVGTTTPASRLSVDGDVDISGSRLHVNSAGNVGIGTATPQAKLHVAGALQADAGIRTGDAIAVNHSSPTEMVDVQGSILARSRLLAGFPNPFFRVDPAAQRVGIGTSSPRQHLSIGANLDLYSGSPSSPTRPSIRGSGSDNLILNASDNGAVYINHDGGTGGVRFHNGTSGGEIARFTGDGRLGLGTTNPLTGLHVAGPGVLFDGLGLTLRDPTGALRTEMNNQNPSGEITTYGPNGNRNVRLSFLNADATPFNHRPNHGEIQLYDENGAWKIWMGVSVQDNGFITADVKNFRIAHPKDPEKEIWYASIEGPEAAAYVRGTAMLTGGEAFVPFPEHFTLVANADTMTVIVTPLSADSLGLAVVEKSADGIRVKELHRGTGSYEFDWEVKAVRAGHEDFRVIRSAADPFNERVEED